MSVRAAKVVFRALVVAFVAALASQAAVTRIEVSERSPVASGRVFGRVGAYEKIAGRVYFADDPTLEVNRRVRDIEFAPRNAGGKVEFSADFYMLAPAAPEKGNGTLLVEISNRGGKGLLSRFDYASSALDPRRPQDFGDGFLLERGYTLVWIGWQFDVPRQPGLLRLYAPVARDGAKAITGLVRAQQIGTGTKYEFALADRNHAAYPVLDPDDPNLRIVGHDLMDWSQTEVLPRSAWQFARLADGKPVADREHIYVKQGLAPGVVYELVYTSIDPPVAGLGFAAVRDFVSFLKHDGRYGNLAPLAKASKRAIGFGISQSGRWLRNYLYDGFNRDEQDRIVFDGVWADVAGAGRGSFNQRFAQPSRDGHPALNLHYPVDLFPFSDLPQTDPETGITGGLLRLAVKDDTMPKIFYTNNSYEYGGRGAALIHVTVDGERDAPFSAKTRYYFIAGAAHGPGRFPPAARSTANLTDPLDHRPIQRALLVDLEAWVAQGVAPPASRYPRLADQTLEAGFHFPAIPGARTPRVFNVPRRLDFGPAFRSRGVATVEPPELGKEYPFLMPRVDADGNPVAGVKMPEVAVPLATYTGWNVLKPYRDAKGNLVTGEPANMIGSWFPFARTREERTSRKDPRLSVGERYRDKKDYLGKISRAAGALVRERFLLPADRRRVSERAAREWDFVMAQAR